MKKLLISFAFLAVNYQLLAISLSDSSLATHKTKKVVLRPVPVLAYAPETRVVVGAGVIAPFKFTDDTLTRHSIVSAYVVYTQNKQYYYYMPYQIFSKNNNYYFEGEADYYYYSYYYWGIGEARVPKELYNVKYPRIFMNAFRKVTGGLYLGVDYYYEHDMMGATQPGGELSEGTILGSRGAVNSGVGVDLLYDTRDSIFFPHRGWYIKGVSYLNYPAIGSTYNYGRITTDISWYHQISKPIVLAFTQHNQLSWGNIPFNELSLVGGYKQIRGYYQGYYRDDALTYVQAEARMHLFGRFGFDAFGVYGYYGKMGAFPESPSPVLAEGIGFRYNYVKKQHINLRADVGYGNTFQYYFTIQEAF